VEGTLEITTNILKKGCAVGCRVCPQELLARSYHPQERIYLSLRDFTAALRKVPLTYRIDFSGYAEPFLNRECSSMMLEAVGQGYAVCCYTTLVGATVEDVEVLASLPFSLPAAPLEIHLPDAAGVMPTKITARYLEVLTALFQKKLPFVTYMTMDPKGRVHPELQSLLKQLDPFRPISRGGSVEGLTPREPLRGPLRCRPMPKLNHNVLLPNGDVQLCCMDYGLQHTLGNLLSGSHEELFTSAGFRAVHQAMKDGGDELLCRRCEMAEIDAP
jgi:hypothetical protein